MSITILNGDCRKMLKTLPAQSVQCCVTSPPYFGLRDYGIDGQLGKEATPNDFVKSMVDVFREVHRALRDDGTLWLNLGDSYASSGVAGKQALDKLGEKLGTGGGKKHSSHSSGRSPTPEGLKTKDLIGIPWRVAFALQADGWYLRQDIIWHKPNPMPESVTDRCTKSHEYIFLLSKSAKYFYDARSISEPAIYAGDDRAARTDNRRGTECNAISSKPRDKRAGQGRIAYGGKRNGEEGNGQESFVSIGETRNKRSVWSISTQPCSEAHFATYPPLLVEPCILAGSKPGDTVLDPFFGAGTTGMVADRLQRHCIGIELNPEYVEISRKRLQRDAGLFSDIK